VVVQAQAHRRYGRAIATWDDVAHIARSLPATEPGTTFRAVAWKVASKPKPKAFVWVRPLTPSDVKALTALGREIPTGELIGLRTADQDEKAALLEQFSEYVFDIPHFHGYAGVLVNLDAIDLDLLEDLIVDAWLALAPRDIAAAFIAEHGGASDEGGD
jgi:hypothetical protein